MGICLCGKFQTGLLRCVACRADFLYHFPVILRMAYYGNVSPVLGCTAEHGRASDVDMLDCILHGDIRLGYGLLERIEVDAYKVDVFYPVFLELLTVALQVAPPEKSAMYLGMKGLNATVAYFRETGDIADVDDFESRFLQKLHCTARGYDVPAEAFECAGEFYHASLIAYGK